MTLMNCPHNDSGWCFDCLQAERERNKDLFLAYKMVSGVLDDLYDRADAETRAVIVNAFESHTNALLAKERGE